MMAELLPLAQQYPDPLELGSVLLGEAMTMFEIEAFKGGALIDEVVVVPDEGERGYHVYVIYNDFSEEGEEQG